MINIYKASAGSGKTFTLAREYIKLILGHKNENGDYVLSRKYRNSHRSVLAITFTNKATEEMKSRIIHELAVIAGCEKGWTDKSPYESYLCDTFRCSPEELRLRAGDALRDLLYDFNFFSISTIDSFFQLILRAFAHEADVSGNYDVELDDAAVTSMGVDQLFQDLNHGKETKRTKYLIRWLSSYMTQMIENGKTFNIFNRSNNVYSDFIKFISGITDDCFRANEDKVIAYLSDLSQFEQFKDAVYHEIRDVKAETATACRTAIDAIQAGNLNECLSKRLYDSLLGWGKDGYSPTSNGDLQAAITSVCEDIDNAYTKKHINSPLRNETVDGLITNAAERCKFCHKQISELRIISDNLYQLGLFSTIIEYIDRYRRENSTILLSDTNSLLTHIIGGEDTPFLFERVGQWFSHYLIDEFQDTSLSQWQNLRPLIRESLSYDHDNLVIGDEKQCIYRFRDSDPSLLHNLHDEPAVKGRAKISGDTLAENTNWRSSVNVIRFNNTLFSAIAKNIGFDDIYRNVGQQISPKHISLDGYVRLSIFDAKEDDPVGRALAELTKDLRRQLISGYRPGDIAILVRKWSEGELIIRHLEAERLADPTFPSFRIVSDNSLRVSRSPAVSLIISQLRLLCASDYPIKGHKKTQKEIAAIVNTYEGAQSNGAKPSDALSLAITYGKNASANTNCENKSNGIDASNTTDIDLITLIESIIDKCIPKESLRCDNLFLTAFQDLVSDFVSHGNGDIRSFLNWWDDKGHKATVAGAADDSSLNILSIHKSKGLEFPCVHIPFAELSESNQSDISWFEIDDIPGIPSSITPPMLPLAISKSMEGTMFEDQYNIIQSQKQLDRLNLLYVAFTRAVDELCIGIKTGGKGKNFSPEIYDGLIKCTPEFVGELNSINGVTVNDFSPFTAIHLDADGVVTLGTPTVPREKATAQKTAMSPSDLTDMPDYYIRPGKSIWENTKLDRYKDMAVARDRGIILHDLMAHIRKPHDIPNAINMLRLAPEAKMLTEDDIQEIQHLITQRVNDERVAAWFNNYDRLLIERPIAIDREKTRRPDRIVWGHDGKVYVIDYKTGSQAPEKYRKQVNEYVDILNSLGHANVTGHLYYLDSGDIVDL